jgi:hypothetical protein
MGLLRDLATRRLNLCVAQLALLACHRCPCPLNVVACDRGVCDRGRSPPQAPKKRRDDHSSHTLDRLGCHSPFFPRCVAEHCDRRSSGNTGAAFTTRRTNTIGCRSTDDFALASGAELSSRRSCLVAPEWQFAGRLQGLRRSKRRTPFGGRRRRGQLLNNGAFGVIVKCGMYSCSCPMGREQRLLRWTVQPRLNR